MTEVIEYLTREVDTVRRDLEILDGAVNYDCKRIEFHRQRIEDTATRIAALVTRRGVLNRAIAVLEAVE